MTLEIKLTNKITNKDSDEFKKYMFTIFAIINEGIKTILLTDGFYNKWTAERYFQIQRTEIYSVSSYSSYYMRILII